MMRRLMWAVRRELWESRWLYIAPVSMAVVLVIGFAAYAFRLPDHATRQAAVEPYDAVAGLMMIAGLLVGIIYCGDALYSERRDRSILLWKSLPVSDTLTVVAKLFIPIVLLPVLVWALTVGVHIIMLLINSAFLAARGQSVGELWAQVQLLSNSVLLFYHLLALHGLSAAPLYGWIIFVSAWAPRAPFAWAILPPVAIGFLERVAFGTMHFAELLLSLLSGGLESVSTPPSGTLMDSMTLLPLGQFLMAPRLWIGFAITAAFIVASVRLRRQALPA
jgi:ABC-2 type transport system permease protein